MPTAECASLESLNQRVDQSRRDVLNSTVLSNPYIKLVPDNARQMLFLSMLIEEVFYGGAAGGGKSAALLAAALQFVGHKGYGAMLIRKSFQDLIQPGALIPMSHEWLQGTDAKWKAADHKWVFPSGAILKFGYIDSPEDVYQFQGAELQYVGFDELTQHKSDFCYRYMFSRIRRRGSLDVPLRMRAASNPGGPGHDWVKQRFITHGRENGRFFIPAGLRDNPHLDREQYERTMSNLDPTTKAQLLNGDWSARTSGTLFKSEWFTRIILARPNGVRNWVRFWDLAATEPEPGVDPDYTVGVLIGMQDGTIFVADVKRFQEKPRIIEQRIRNTAIADGRGVRVRMEEEKGSAGKNLIDHYQRHILAGWDFAGTKPSGETHVLAGPLASAAQAGNVVLVSGMWLAAWIDELEGYPFGSHDDQVKATCLGLQELVNRIGLTRIFVPKAIRPALPPI